MAKKQGSPGIKQASRSDDAPAWLIQRTARLLRVLFLRLVQAQEVEVTPEMWLVLSRLLARDGQYQNELADSTFRDRPNTSRIISGLEERGLVRRAPDREDRRRTRIHITQPGRELVAATAPVAARTRDWLYDGLKKKELKALRRALRRIEANTLEAIENLEDLRAGKKPAKKEPPAD
jgi:DNA-binding MarR family transcriptional regulator